MCPRASVFVPVLLIVCCGLIMAPRLLAPRFGLLDDGSTLLIADAYEHNPLGVVNIEATRGRFRPVYWLYYIEQYPLWGKAPAGYFVVQLVALAITTVIVGGLAVQLTDSLLAGFIAGIAFLISGPVIEAYYTLSKPEPPLVLFVAAATLCLFRAMRTDGMRQKAFLVATTLFTALAYLTKESAVVLLPISIVFALVAWPNRQLRATLLAFCVVNLVCTLGFTTGRFLTATSAIAEGSDSSNYVLNGAQLAASATDALAWFIRDFAFVIPLVIGAVLVARRGPADAKLLAQFGGLLTAGWILIMLPWRSSFEYYLLPVAFGVALVAGATWAMLRQQPRERSMVAFAAGAVSLLLGTLPVVNEFTTARLQLGVDQANADVAQALAYLTPSGGVVVTSLAADSEYVFELGMQLREVYGRGDVQVEGGDSGGASNVPGTLVVIQRIEHRPVVMPRVAAGTTHFDIENGVASRSVWSTASQLQLGVINVQEPMCRVVRGLGGPPGGMCQDPVLVIDRELFAYGWDIYRVG